jgi:hypothetical protein
LYHSIWNCHIVRPIYIFNKCNPLTIDSYFRDDSNLVEAQDYILCDLLASEVETRGVIVLLERNPSIFSVLVSVSHIVFQDSTLDEMFVDFSWEAEASDWL